MDRKVKVFLEKDQQRKEVQVEIKVKGGRPRVWLEEKTQPPQEQKRDEDQPAQEHGSAGMHEDTPEENRPWRSRGWSRASPLSRMKTKN